VIQSVIYLNILLQKLQLCDEPVNNFPQVLLTTIRIDRLATMSAETFIVGKALEDEPEIKQPRYAGIVPKVNFRWILSGPSKSGKSNLARWCLDHYYTVRKNKSWFDDIYLLSPTANIDYIWSNLTGLKAKNRITDPTPKTILKILNDQKREIMGSSSDSAAQSMSASRLAKKKQSAKKVLIIFDDAIAESSMINSKEFLKVFVAGRHYGISSMVMTQSYVKVPRSVRLQATHLCMFPSRSTEIERLYTEHGPKELSKNQFTELVEFATRATDEDRFPFLYVDAFAPPSRRFRRGFTDVLEIHDDIGTGGGGQPPSTDDSRDTPPRRRPKRG